MKTFIYVVMLLSMAWGLYDGCHRVARKLLGEEDTRGVVFLSMGLYLMVIALLVLLIQRTPA